MKNVMKFDSFINENVTGPKGILKKLEHRNVTVEELTTAIEDAISSEDYQDQEDAIMINFKDPVFNRKNAAFDNLLDTNNRKTINAVEQKYLSAGWIKVTFYQDAVSMSMEE